MLPNNPPNSPLTLSGFPTLRVGPGTNNTTVYRSHDAYNPDGTLRDPRYFSPMHITPSGERKGGRFDLQHPLGTCNTGATKAAALRERLAHSEAAPSSALEKVRVSTLRIRRPLLLLDGRCDGPGYTARDISDRDYKETGYDLTQQFAQTAYEAGFDGIIITCSVCQDDNVYFLVNMTCTKNALTSSNPAPPWRSTTSCSSRTSSCPSCTTSPIPSALPCARHWARTNRNSGVCPPLPYLEGTLHMEDGLYREP